ncbi:MAG: Do family serine endopeptidase [Kiritimatiellae bacterium]|nr:Do family serine endopeptidase [Kiritimatiellia bacterium]
MKTANNVSKKVVMTLCICSITLYSNVTWSKNSNLAETTGKGFSQVAKKTIPAVVFIRVEKIFSERTTRSRQLNDPFGFFGDDFLERFFGGSGYRRPPPKKYYQQGEGSGFIISKDGYILTNNHVVGDVDKIIVRLHDGREFEGKLIGTDPHSEVAVIKIDADDLPTLPLGNSSDLEIGEWVIAIGNPFGLSETLTAGVVSAKGRNNIGIADYENFIQTDAAINPGNSGGPLLNTKGEAVGINTAIYSRSGGYMGIGFAIPINMARSIKDQLVKTGKVERGYIGIIIQDLNMDLAQSFGLDEPKGILIAKVVAGLAGEKAGLKSGDIILKLNGEPVKKTSIFRNEITTILPRSTIKLEVLRDSQVKNIEVTIGSLDPDTAFKEASKGGVTSSELGIAVENLTSEWAQRFGYELGQGVIVARVDSGSGAERAGLRPGILITSVDRQPITNVKEFKRALSKKQKNNIILFYVTDGSFSGFITLKAK